MKRRDFLRATTIGGAAALGSSAWTRRAKARSFGEIPSGLESSMLPQGLRVKNVLECFLMGGITPWETFYCVPERGRADETFAYTNYEAMLLAAEGCGFEDASTDPFTYFGKDSSGQEIFFGPFMKKLLARQDVAKRLRVVVNRHEEVTHDAASPLVATGRSASNPMAAGLGTHISRYFSEADADASHPTPFAYNLGAGSTFIPNSNIGFSAQGLHPGNARTLLIRPDASRLLALLNRPTVGTVHERAQYDDLMRVYFERYSERLKLNGSGAALRADAFDQQLRAFASQLETDAVKSMLDPSYLDPLPTGPSCRRVINLADGGYGLGEEVYPSSTVRGNLPATAVRLARHLLTHPTHPARYFTFADMGIAQADGGGGYDTHSDGPWRQASNLNNLIDWLFEAIKAPGESTIEPKLDLDDTLIILTTEFGRTPGRQSVGSQGRNHWPHGFAQIYIGGPIREAQAGVYGHIDETGVATAFTTPAENRIAALLALGIYPFEREAFDVGDVQGQTETGAAARSVIQRVFGHSV